MPPTRIGPYRILKPLGEGGMGVVYEALHDSIERRVALKVLHPEYARNPDAVTRFFNEARAVNRIEHPNIVQISEFGQADDGAAYLVMEFLRGETLDQRLERLVAKGRRMQLAEVVQIGVQLADALAAAHEKGIVHRDLKPCNVMLVPDTLSPSGERVKLLDFGIAKLTQGAGGKATKTNALMGTPQYMSPEQCRGAGGVDDRTDVYALGVILYELLAGRPPFVAEEPIAYLAMHNSQPPPPLADRAPQTPEKIRKLVHRLLEKDKAARPPMREVRATLLQLLSKLSGPSRAATDSSETIPRVMVASSSPPSTLGGSLGQTVRSLPIRRKAAVAVAVAAVFVAGALTRVVLRKPASVEPAAAIRSVPSPGTQAPLGEAVDLADHAIAPPSPARAVTPPATSVLPTSSKIAKPSNKVSVGASSAGRPPAASPQTGNSPTSSEDNLNRHPSASESQSPSRQRPYAPAPRSESKRPASSSSPRRFVD